MIGKKFGRLTVTERDTTIPNTNVVYYKCTWDCGNVTSVRSSNLSSGNTKSCGCYNHEMLVKNHTKHGLRNTRLYRIWKRMRSRCNNPNNDRYEYYGARGISICSEWDEFINFYNWSMKHGYNDELTIDRIDVNGNYEPSNCRWADWSTQQKNKRKY